MSAKTDPVIPRPVTSEVVSVSHAPDAGPKKEKLSYFKRVKLFFQALKMRLFPAADALYYIITIILAIFISPIAIMVAGLWMKDDRWLLHTLLNLLVVILAWVLFFVTCGIGAFVTLLMLTGAFAHALWYIITRGR